MTKQEYAKWVLDFDPAKHEIVDCYDCVVQNTVIADCSLDNFNDGTPYSIRLKNPQPKTRPMNYAELRALALRGAWFRDYEDRCFPIRVFVNETEELSGMAVDGFHAIYKDCTIDGITFHPLTVTEE